MFAAMAGEAGCCSQQIAAMAAALPGRTDLLSRADPAHAAWIDSSGARVDFKGGWNGTVMVLEGYWQDLLAPGKGALVRMTYSQGPDGSVRQLGEASENNGKSWQPSFDFTYRRAKRS